MVDSAPNMSCKRSVIWRAVQGLIVLLPAIVFGRPSSQLQGRGLPWGDGIPTPVPAASVGPLDWASISASLYSPPVVALHSLRLSKVLALDVTSDTTLSTPTAVDWRERNGMNYITTPQNQGSCQSCWAFGVTALIDAMIRIEHYVWSKRSEADVHDAVGAACESVGNAEDTLAFLSGTGAAYINDTDPPPGIADWPCDPYEATLHGYTPCADRTGRSTRIPFYQAMGEVDDQKRWIAEYGPIVATFQLYSDFQPWKMDDMPVYKVGANATSDGNHIALIVGYDDDKGAWIAKNSWGSNWGDHGFVYFGYGEANIDGWTKYGLTNVNPDPWARKRHQSGNMMQSGNGKTHRNLELVLAVNSSSTSDTSHTFTHISQDGDTTEWSIASHVAAGNATPAAQPIIIGTSSNRDFAAVFLDQDQNVQQWLYNQTNQAWKKGAALEGQETAGVPGLAQDDDSALVLAIKHSDGTLREWRQQPSTKAWVQEALISSDIKQSGPSLVISNINQDIYTKGSRGNIYLAAVGEDGAIHLFWRLGTSSTWTAGEAFGSGVGDTPPVMIQDFFDTANETSHGGFQLVVAVNGTVQHWQRNNSDILSNPPVVGEPGSWTMAEAVGSGVRHVWTLVQGSFGGRLHMLTEGVDGKFSYWEWDGSWKVVEVLPELDELDDGTVTGEVNGG